MVGIRLQLARVWADAHMEGDAPMAATVLCVDDDHHLCRILQKALTREGFEVALAHDGDAGVQAVRSEAPGLVLLDLLLPKRDGFAVLEALRALPGPEAQTPVVMMTGCRVTPAYRERARRLGVSALLEKPVPLEKLSEEVRRHVKEGPPRVEGRKAAARARAASPRNAGRAAAGTRGGQPPLRGTLDELGFPHLLHHLHGLRATGVLLVSNGRKRKAIQLRDGYPVAVQSNLVGECFGNLLMRRGVLDRQALDESLRRVKRGEGLQGQILVAMEALTEEQVSDALREQAEEKLFEIFEWTTGSFQFEVGGRLKRGNELALDASPANIVLRGVRQRMPLAVVDGYLRERSRSFLVPGESPFYRTQDIGLDVEEEAFLASVDGTRRVSDLVAGSDEPMRRTLFALLASELLDLRDDRAEGAQAAQAAPAGPHAATDATRAGREAAPPARLDARQERALRTELAATAERLRGMSYYEMLGVAEDASEEELDRAFDEAARRIHPDRYSHAGQAVRQLAAEVHGMLARAHATLGDPRERKLYEAELRKGERQAAEEQQGRRALEAETEFQKGESNLRARDYEIALRYFGSALQRYPEEGEYHAHYGWCLYLCHPDDSTIAQEAIEHVKRGVKLARDREKPYLFLGRLYKAVGRSATAEKMFTRAVQIRPDSVEALREIRLMNLRRQKGKGLVRRLLRR